MKRAKALGSKNLLSSFPVCGALGNTMPTGWGG